MRLKIHHVTRYRFDEPVTFALQQVRKTPKNSHGQAVWDWQTRVNGGTRELGFVDHHNNACDLISYDRSTTEVEIVSCGEVELTDTQGIVGRHVGPAPLWLYTRASPRTEARSGLREMMRGLERDDTLAMLHALTARIRAAVSYEIGASDPRWSAEEALAAGRGVCQDHAHVFVAAARHLGLPARYVSGYLLLDDRTLQDAMHAWAEVHVDGLGWVGFDVSNGISPDHRYVRVATGLDYGDAAPVSGTRIGGSGEQLEVRIEVAQQ